MRRKTRENCSNHRVLANGRENTVHRVASTRGFSSFFFVFSSFRLRHRPISFSLGAAFARMERRYNNSGVVMRRARAGDTILFFATILPIFRDSRRSFFLRFEIGHFSARTRISGHDLIWPGNFRFSKSKFREGITIFSEMF